jgi:NADP-dependent 3-hydroxy acid dehydrogenase YdfG
MPTIAIVGVGPLLGMAIARKFGREGFRVGLVARRAATLREYEQQLQALGIEAAGFAADATDATQLTAALSAIKQRFGAIDVLEFSPTQWNKGDYEATVALATTAESATDDFNLLVRGAIVSARQVLPDMLDAKTGTLFFTTGYSAIKPMPIITSLCIANAGLRSYAYCLHEELAPKGVYAATVSINVFIQPGTATDPDNIAELYWDMHCKRDRVEAVFSSGD